MVATAFQVQQLARDTQAQLGLIAAALASKSFQQVNVRTGAGADDWASEVAQQAQELRRVSAQIAVTTYQLARWLQTGHTLGDTGLRDGEDLTHYWLELMLDTLGMPAANSVLGAEVRSALRWGADDGFTDLARRVAGFGQELAAATGSVGFDPWNWDRLAVGDSTRIATILRERALRKAREQLRSETNLSADRLEEITHGASSRGAGLADALVMQGGRAVPINTALGDSRLVYYARGTSTNPCAFCAMLASRGPVYSESVGKTYASLTNTVRSYHDNCHCFPIFSFSDDTDLPPQNKFFEDNWARVTEGYYGKQKLSAWRRWLNANRQANGGALNISSA